MKYRDHKFCAVLTSFIDEDDYRQLFLHVIPVFIPPDSEDYDVEFWINENVHRWAKDGNEDIGWPARANSGPWEGTTIESAGDDFYYTSIPSDMLVDPDELKAMSKEDRKALENESSTLALEVFHLDCFDTPELAVKEIYDHYPSTNSKVRIWCIQPDPEDDPEFRDSVDSYDVVHRGLLIDPYCEPQVLEDIEGWLRVL